MNDLLKKALGDAKAKAYCQSVIRKHRILDNQLFDKYPLL